jgi:hypothetical protein
LGDPHAADRGKLDNAVLVKRFVASDAESDQIYGSGECAKN